MAPNGEHGAARKWSLPPACQITNAAPSTALTGTHLRSLDDVQLNQLSVCEDAGDGFGLRISDAAFARAPGLSASPRAGAQASAEHVVVM